MDKGIIDAETMLQLFEIFLDDMLKNAIKFEDYTSEFREEYGVDKNSPFEFMFNGFIGGVYVSTLAFEKGKSDCDE